MFIAVVTEDGEPQKKAFGFIEDARQFCKQASDNGADKSEIYELPYADAREAVAAHSKGEGALISAYTPKPSATEIAAAQHLIDWDELREDLGLPKDSLIRRVR